MDNWYEEPGVVHFREEVSEKQDTEKELLLELTSLYAKSKSVYRSQSTWN